MKRCLWILIVLCTMATPAVAASVVYLKDGGEIRAQSVWQSQGRVYVLVNRESITDFSPAEIKMKRTFPPKHHRVKKQCLPTSAPAASTGAAPEAAANSSKAGSTYKSLLSKLPSLPADKSPESLVPSSGAGGTIKQHKKEMAERANE